MPSQLVFGNNAVDFWIYVGKLCTCQCQMYSPAGGGGVGIPWGLDCQNSYCPGKFDRWLVQVQDLNLRCFSEKISKKLSLNWGFLTQNCVTWVGLDPNFQNCPIPLGSPAITSLGENIDRCISPQPNACQDILSNMLFLVGNSLKK